MHKKYTYKDGKRFGPYLYETRRVGGKIITRYVGKASENKSFNLLPFTVLLLFLSLTFVFLIYNYGFTGNVALDIQSSYNPGDLVNGTLRLIVKQGELIPANSLVGVSLGNESKQFFLSDLVSSEKVNGKFYVEGHELSGTGEGFGLEGVRTLAPEVSFKFIVSRSGNVSTGISGGGSSSGNQSGSQQNSQQQGAATTNVTPQQNSTQQTNSSTQQNNSVSTSGQQTTNSTTQQNNTVTTTQQNSSQSNSQQNSQQSNSSQASSSSQQPSSGGSSEPAAPAGQPSDAQQPSQSQASGTNQQTSSSETQGSGEQQAPVPDSESSSASEAAASAPAPAESSSESSSDSSDSSSSASEGSSITGSVISENEFIVTAVVSAVSNFSYVLDNGETARIVPGSVVVNGTQVSDSYVTLVFSSAGLTATTSYVNYERGFGSDFLGTNTTDFFVDISSLGFVAMNSSAFVVRLSYSNQTFVNVSRDISVTQTEIQIQNVTNQTNETLNTNISINTTQYSAVLGKPVKWRKEIKLEEPSKISVELPKGAQNVTVTSVVSGNESDSSVDPVNVGLTGQVTAQLNLDRKPSLLSRIFKLTGFAVQEDNQTLVEINESVQEVTVEYYTDAPTSVETDTPNGKEVKIIGPEDVHYENVLAYTDLSDKFDVRDSSRIRIYWKDENTYLPVENTQDTNGDGAIDYLEWVAPHLSNQTFEIIVVNNALHLDENRTFVSDISDSVKTLDGIWSETIPDGHYVRATFEKNLTDDKDITIYPRVIEGSPTIEVYEQNQSTVIATFGNLINDSYSKIYLTNLSGKQDTFDLHVIGGSVQFDHIVDPVSNVFFDDFESGSLSKWDGNGATAWQIVTDQAYGGTHSLKASNNHEGDIITDDIDTTGANFINVSFHFRDDDLDNGDIDIYFYNGTAYVLQDVALGIEQSVEDTWYPSSRSTSDSQFFVSNFRVRFNANVGSAENLWLDDFTVNTTTTADTTPPQVTINFPQNTTYYLLYDLPFTFNVSLNENGSVLYTLDGGANNYTMAGNQGNFGTQFTALNDSVDVGGYTFTVYANDTAGNNNYSESVNFNLVQENILLNGTVSDASGSDVNSTIVVYDESSSEVVYNQTDTSQEVVLPLNTTYTVEVHPIDIDSVDKIQFTNLNFSDANSSAVSIVNVDETNDSGNFSSIFSIDPQIDNFENASVFFTATSNSLFKCAGWDFASQTCSGNWTLFLRDLVPGQQYNFTLNPGDPGFGAINITNATHLDENFSFVSNIYESVKDLDDVWSETIPDGHYVRVIFTQNLTSNNDITVYPRNVSGDPKINVYDVDTSALVAQFTSISDNQYNTRYLTGLNGSQNTFDLLVYNGSLQFDHIVDPTLVIDSGNSPYTLCGTLISYTKIVVDSTGILNICPYTGAGTGYADIYLGNNGNFTVVAGGVVNGTGAGATGGAGTVTASVNATQGTDGNTSTAGAASFAPNGGGGGGGKRTSVNEAAGGGGGGFGGAGGRGGNTTAAGTNQTGGFGGLSYGSLSDLTLKIGSGGGGSASDTARTGGRGGGGFKVDAGNGSITVGGLIDVNGSAGVGGASTDEGASGGGSGGHVILKAYTINLGSGIISAVGGVGGSATGATDNCGGGGGGGGRILVSYNNTFSNSSSLVNVSAGAAGSSVGCDTNPTAGSIGSVSYSTSSLTSSTLIIDSTNSPYTLCGEVAAYGTIFVDSTGILNICPFNGTGRGYVNISLGNNGNFTVVAGGVVNGTGAGATGGAGITTASVNATQGTDGNTSTAGAASFAPNGGGGGGGKRTSVNEGAGGGGGGFGGAGGRGGNTTAAGTNQTGGFGGLSYGSLSDLTLKIGSGGGGGAGDTAWAGGRGGAGIEINASNGIILIEGIVNVSGTDGIGGSATDAGAGGGGSGGHAIFIANTLNFDDGIISVAGGRGGSATGATDNCGGGGGGGGRAVLIYQTISNSSTLLNNSAGAAGSSAGCDTNPTAGSSGEINYTSTVVPDTTPPAVTVNSPLNQTYGSLPIVFNISTNENSSANYTLTGGVVNYTLQNNGNINFNATNSSIADGNYVVKFYVWDTSNNLNNTVNVSFHVETGTSISTCRTIGVANSTYNLSANLSVSGDCLNISANNVTINGNGFALIGNGSGFGIDARDKNSVVIVNATISNFTTSVITVPTNSTSGNSAGNVTLLYSTVDSVNATGASGNSAGGSGGTVTVVRSQVKNIIFGGGDAFGSGNGGNSGKLALNYTSSQNVTIKAKRGKALVSGSNGSAPNIKIAESQLNYSIINSDDLSTLEIENPQYGDIQFSEVNLSAAQNLSSYVNISSNYVFVNSTAASALNVSANVTLYNVPTFEVAAIYKDGVPCPDCVLLSSSIGGNVSFSVSGFSTYKIVDVSNGGVTINVTKENNFSHLTINDSNILVYLPFDVNASSTTAYDYSNFSNDATLVGTRYNSSTAYATGYTILANGSSYINIGNSSSINGIKNFTVAFWIYSNNLTGGSGANSFLAGQGSASTQRHGLFMLGSGAFTGVLSGSIGSTITLTNDKLDTGRWFHLAYTYDDGGDKKLRVYINGTEASYIIQNAASGITAGPTIPLMIGALSDGSSATNATYDEFIVYNRTLNSTEINKLYSNQTARFKASGEQKFDSLNVSQTGSENKLNVTISSSISLGTNLSVIVGSDDGKGGYDYGSEVNFSKNKVTGIDVTSPGNLSVRIIFRPNTNLFYTPILIGNITLDSYTAQATPLQINFTGQTPANGSTQQATSIFVNISSNYSGGDHYTFLDFNKDLRLWLRMDDTNSSGGFVDLSSWGNNASAKNGATTNTSGLFGNATNFDGTDDYLEVANTNSLNITGNQITISAWVNPNTVASAFQYIVGKAPTNSAVRPYGLMIETSTIRFFLNGYGSASNIAVASSISASTWTHLVGTYNGTTMRLFKNGVQIGETNTTITINSDTIPVYVSCRDNSGSPAFCFNGLIDEVLIYNRSLDSNEVLSLYNATATQYYHNFTGLPQAQYNFTAYTVNKLGNKNQTEQRTVTIATASSINITYPIQYATYQRSNLNLSNITIYGTYGGSPTAIEARFNGQNWQTINNTPSGNSFRGVFVNASLGQGNLEVRFTNDNSVNSSISQIGVGDLYVITGASNADGHGDYVQRFNRSLPYNATFFDDINLTWKIADDPVSNFTSVGSYYPILASYIVQNANVPVGFITAAYDGSTTLDYGRTDTFLYTRMISQISRATNGTMRVKAAILHTGGNDATNNYPYSWILPNITFFANNFVADTVGSSGIIVAEKEARFSGVNRSEIDDVRRAMKDSWNYGNISYGPTLYDIELGPDTVHFTSNQSLQLQAQRFWAVLNAHFYNTSFDARGPRVADIAYYRRGVNSSIEFKYLENSTPLVPSNGVVGYRIVDPNNGVLNDTNISSAYVSGNSVVINLRVNVTQSSNISYASFNDAYNTTSSLKDSSNFSLPAETFFNLNINNTPSSIINFTGQTPANASRQSATSIFVNVSSSDSLRHAVYPDFDNGLKLWLTMDDINSSGDALDLSSWGNNASAKNGVVRNLSGYYGSAFNFDGTDDYLEVANTNSLNITGNQITISAWVNPNTVASAFQYIVGKAATNSADRPYGLMIETSTIRFFLNGYATPSNIAVASSISASTWTHLVGTYNGTTMRLFKNGVQIGETNTTITINSDTIPVYVSCRDNSGSPAFCFNGLIDEVLIYNRSLDSNEVLSLYNATATQYYHNFTGLSGGDHNVVVRSINERGYVNSTSRQITINSVSTPAPTLNSTDGSNKTLQNLNCYATVADPQGDRVNVTVQWWNNSAFALNVDYNNSYANGTFFNASLAYGNTTKGQNWTCYMKFFDGVSYSSFNQSRDLTILNSLPVVTLLTPPDSSSTTNRAPNFTWSAVDDDGDTLTYEFNITCQSGCSSDNRYVQNINVQSYTLSSDLQHLYDNGFYYNWTVRANDTGYGTGYGSWANFFRINVSSYIAISLPNDSVNFGQIAYLASNDTTDDSPLPLLIQNDGNAFVNISVNASNLWNTVTNPTAYYKFKIRNNTLENGSFNWGSSITTFTNVPGPTPSVCIAALNYTNATDSAKIDLYIEVPPNEGSGVRSSNITFTASLGE